MSYEEVLIMLKELKNYTPTASHTDSGVNFNLYKLHVLFDYYIDKLNANKVESDRHKKNPELGDKK